ncbi:MAG: hypothetical protein ABIT07_00770 [Ferruginibacter sp.]
MKKNIFLFILAGYSALLNAQSLDKEPYLTKSLSNESVKNVTLETIGGNISVIAVDGSETRLEVFVNPNNNKENSSSKEEIKRRLEQDYDFNISVSGYKLTAIAKPKNTNKTMNWKMALHISFKAFVPKIISTDLSTNGGNITLKGISGTQNFFTSGGNLNLENISGKVKGRTSGGNIYVVNTKDDIDLSTSGGNIIAGNCSGNLTLSTSGGSLSLSGLRGKINATTSGGNVRGNKIEGELFTHSSGGNIILNDMYCSLETSTSGGNIDVAIKEFGKFTKINNSGGNITLQIPKNKGADLRLSARKIITEALSNFTGKMEDDNITGAINGGGAPVNVAAGSGKIYLSFK